MEAEIPFYKGNEKVNPDYHHGQIRIMGGVKCYQVARADSRDENLSDSTLSTYKHAPDMAYYHGRFYIMYLCNPRDEHSGAGFSMLTSSCDGKNFYDHRECFPIYRLPKCEIEDYKSQKHVFTGEEYACMHQRRCFYRAKNDCMLLLGFYGYPPHKWMVCWDNYGIGRVVRRLFPDGSMSDIYFLLPNYQAGFTDELLIYDTYDKSEDEEFVEACRELINDPLAMQSFAEENGDAHENIKVKHPKDGTYQAFCYYHLNGEKVVGLWKHSFAAISHDNGQSFTTPQKSSSLVMSGQKVWGQRMPDGRYVMVYDPTLESTHRYPMCCTFSEDGLAFDDMRVVHGEVPPRRYGGFWKDFGPQYMRGIAEGITTLEDHPDEDYVYVTYSVNKEDIWIAHIPVKGIEDEDSYIIYRPWLSSIEKEQEEEGRVTGFSIKNQEPYDYAKVIKTFPNTKRADVSFRVDSIALRENNFYIELIDERQQVAVMLRITINGMLQIRTTAWQNVCEFNGGTIEMSADCNTNELELKVGDNLYTYKFYTSVNDLRGIIFRNGPARTLPDRDTDAEIDEDLPYRPCTREDEIKILDLVCEK